MANPQIKHPFFSLPNSWKVLIVVTLLIGLFLRCANLDQKVYSADEVRSILRLSGYTSQEFIDQEFTGEIITVEQIQKYQRPNGEKNLNDAIKSLAGNPEHPPLYHLLTRFWMQLFNQPIAARFLSIVFSILALPAMYWLALELFNFPLTGWVAICLMALSPFHILAAQNTTQYSLWTLGILLSSAALLRALRLKNRLSWLLYGITLVMGFYTHLFFAIVAFTQSLYVFVSKLLKIINLQSLFRYILTVLASIVAFSPWLFVFLTNLDKVNKNTQYYRQFKTNLPAICKTIFYYLGTTFVEFFHRKGKLEFILHSLIFILVLYAIYYLIKTASIRVWLFIVLLIFIPLTVQVVPDLMGTSIRSLQARYYLPCFLGSQLAVAYLISQQVNSSLLKSWQRRVWQVLFLSLLLLGIISGIALSETPDAGLDDQRGTASSTNLEIAPIINKAERPLVISDATHSFILALSHLVDEKVKFQLLNTDDVKTTEKKLNLSEASQEFSDIFLLYPDEKISKFIDKYPNFSRKPLTKGLEKILKKTANP